VEEAGCADGGEEAAHGEGPVEGVGQATSDVRRKLGRLLVGECCDVEGALEVEERGEREEEQRVPVA